MTQVINSKDIKVIFTDGKRVYIVMQDGKAKDGDVNDPRIHELLEFLSSDIPSAAETLEHITKGGSN